MPDRRHRYRSLCFQKLTAAGGSRLLQELIQYASDSGFQRWNVSCSPETIVADERGATAVHVGVEFYEALSVMVNESDVRWHRHDLGPEAEGIVARWRHECRTGKTSC